MHPVTIPAGSHVYFFIKVFYFLIPEHTEAFWALHLYYLKVILFVLGLIIFPE